MEQPTRRPPKTFASTAELTREEWLAYRRQGIGGSDAASVLGISPFRTGVDLYYQRGRESRQHDTGDHGNTSALE